MYLNKKNSYYCVIQRNKLGGNLPVGVDTKNFVVLLKLNILYQHYKNNRFLNIN